MPVHEVVKRSGFDYVALDDSPVRLVNAPQARVARAVVLGTAERGCPIEQLQHLFELRGIGRGSV
jgi:hypothetical protein